MTYMYFIGIDISKDSFEACLHASSEAPQGAKGDADTPQTCQFPNDTAGFSAFKAAYAEVLPQALVVLEATGRYEQALLCWLIQAGVAVHRASGLQTACFTRSLRLQGKTDRTDAVALARYAAERHAGLPLATIPDDREAQLDALLAYRQDILAMKVAQQQRVQHPRYAMCRDKVQKTLEFLSEDLADVEAEMMALVAQDTVSMAVMKVMQTVPGVGKQTALTLLTGMPELGLMTRRQAASLAGVAPHPKESGKHQGYRATRGGRSPVKKALFMAALAASRGKSSLGDYYRRLVKEEGKKPIVALIATARKIITIINARLRDYFLLNLAFLGR